MLNNCSNVFLIVLFARLCYFALEKGSKVFCAFVYIYTAENRVFYDFFSNLYQTLKLDK